MRPLVDNDLTEMVTWLRMVADEYERGEHWDTTVVALQL